jgi:hypothetical protein
VGDLVNFIFDHFLDSLCFPLLGGGPYLRGFLFGTLSALALGWSARFILFHRARILVFFATVQPSLKPSASGYERMRGCSCSALLLATLGLTMLAFGYGIVYALSR